ncbi:PEP-CTERM sorting domain-containing protein [Pontiella agarivorans]|uniref:PEP-CTERM sorting domain-containing protein n=1 Tax=Pontiella agarivorans TaxID=3038953 RepID=A0ABU5MTI5_9BACT|nr:PEP-CTERM sorting domain-containing protein [Pontiella agarivorans]MDZ8117483.1 PEP-CTERM sorting domain-containing protein [Pontiella agarivorans]
MKNWMITLMIIPAVVAHGSLLTDNFDSGLDAAWTISYQGTSDADTYAVASGAESAFTAASNPTGKSLLMYDASTNGEVNLRFTMDSGSVGAGETLKVQFDFMSPNSSPATLANMQVQSGTGKASNTSFFQNKSGTDSNQFLNHDGNSNVTLSNTMKEDTWYRFIGEYSANGADPDTYKITLTEYGGATQIWDTTPQNDKASVNSVLFHWNIPEGSKGKEYYLDNVDIAVIPEPATLGLIALFGGGMLVVRRCFSL